MSEETKTEPEAVTPPETDLDSLSEDQLASMIDGKPAPESTQEDPLADQEPAVEDQLEATETDDPGETEEPEEPDINAQLTELRERFEKADLQRQAVEERSKHKDFLLSRKAGEAGNLLQRLRALEGQPAQPAPLDPDPYADQTVTPQQAPPSDMGHEIRSELDEMRQQRFIDTARSEFTQVQGRNKAFWDSVEQLPAEEKAGFSEAFQTKLKEEFSAHEQDILDAQARGDGKLISSIVRSSYGAALFDARSEHSEKLLATRQVNQADSLRERKLAAAAGSSGTRPTPRRKSKSLNDLTPEELAAEIDRRAAEGAML